MEIPSRELQHCNTATTSRVQARLSYAERQQCRQRQHCNRECKQKNNRRNLKNFFKVFVNRNESSLPLQC